MIYKKLGNVSLFKNFNEIRENSIKGIKNYNGFDNLPKINSKFRIKFQKIIFFLKNSKIWTKQMLKQRAKKKVKILYNNIGYII